MATVTEGNAHLLTEQVVTLREASKLIPTRPHIATLHRWCYRGVKGHKLETYLIGNRLVTSAEAVTRFLTAIQQGEVK